MSTVIAMNMVITQFVHLRRLKHRVSRIGDKRVNTDPSHLSTAGEIMILTVVHFTNIRIKIMKHKTSTLMAILSAAGIMSLSAGTAVAGSVADINSDGMVTSEEVVAYVQMNYLKINKNNGHTLNAKEAAELEELFDIDG